LSAQGNIVRDLVFLDKNVRGRLCCYKWIPVTQHDISPESQVFRIFNTVPSLFFVKFIQQSENCTQAKSIYTYNRYESLYIVVPDVWHVKGV
jgi:hypothetical protein